MRRRWLLLCAWLLWLSGCETPPELCLNNRDDDGDGAADCADPDCSLSSACDCGNRALDPGEECDGALLGGQDCFSLGFDRGNLTCDSACEFDTSNCLDNPPEDCDNQTDDDLDGELDCQDTDCANFAACRCGNGILDPGEQCDGSDLAGQDCLDRGFASGQLLCGADCKLDTSECIASVCGNNLAEPGEACEDGNIFNGDGCSSLCVIEFCGDGIDNNGILEECDDGNPFPGDGCAPSCEREICGDGFLDIGEVCDDGNQTPGDGCRADCRGLEVCGDLLVDLGETCDDGNFLPGDDCSADCQRECGDGVLAFAEECDDGNTADGDGCSADCRAEDCGDGATVGAEVCDDGNVQGGDGCRADCLGAEVCGDGLLDGLAGEGCDDGNTTAGDGCDAACLPEICGDGALDAGEACDDGNTAPGDGCRADCLGLEVCGDGLTDPSNDEGCDDGNLLPEDGCDALCAPEFCGDGRVQPGLLEACDDSNQSSGDGCDAACVIEVCGDGIDNNGNSEACDDGNTITGDGCSAACTLEVCGDGILNQAQEVCDDGNTLAGDGCRADCLGLEVCGDGRTDEGEDCDDGNTADGDGCAPGCVLERCGDGAVNGGGLASLRIEYAASNCGGPGATSSLSLNGSAPLSLPVLAPCGCEPGVSVLETSDPALLDALRAVDNRFTVVNSDANVGLAWVLVLLRNDNGTTQEEIALDINGGGDAQARNPNICNAGFVFGGGSVAGPSFQPSQPEELCDDGNQQDGDGCASDCQIEQCGDGFLQGAEQCDDGNLLADDGCEPDCRFACGAGVNGDAIGAALDPASGSCFLGFAGPLPWQDAEEDCEARGGHLAVPNNASENLLARAATVRGRPAWIGVHDRVSESFTNPNTFAAVTGGPLSFHHFSANEPNNFTFDEDCALFGNDEDGWRDFPCDRTSLGNLPIQYTCELAAQPCGDGVRQPNEACDDGNTTAGDGCAPACTLEANAFCTTEEDPPAPSQCLIEQCGDGLVTPSESCDDGNTQSGDGCTATCAPEFCGDGLVNGGTSLTGLRLLYAATNCGGNVLTVTADGGAVVQVPANGICGCSSGLSSVTVSDAAFLAQLAQPGSSLAVSFSGVAFAWMVAELQFGDGSITQEVIVADVNTPGDAESRNVDICADLPLVFAGNTSSAPFSLALSPETCDDGNTTNGDGCDADCQP